MEKKLPTPDSEQARVDDARLSKTLQRGDAELKAGRNEQALETYLSVLRTVQPREDILPWLERLLGKIKSVPGHGHALDIWASRARQIADILLVYEKPDIAAAVCKFLAATYPDDAEWQGRAVWGIYCAGSMYEALQQVEKILQRWPDEGYSLVIKINNLRAYGQCQEAIPIAEKLIERNPSFRLGWITLGILYLTMVEFDNSIEIFKRACRQFPDDATLVNYLGVCYRLNFCENEELDTFRKGALLFFDSQWTEHNMLWYFLHEPGPFVEETFAALRG